MVVGAGLTLEEASKYTMLGIQYVPDLRQTLNVCRVKGNSTDIVKWDVVGGDRSWR